MFLRTTAMASAHGALLAADGLPPPLLGPEPAGLPRGLAPLRRRAALLPCSCNNIKAEADRPLPPPGLRGELRGDAAKAAAAADVANKLRSACPGDSNGGDTCTINKPTTHTYKY